MYNHGFLLLETESLRSGENQTKLGNLPRTRLESRLLNLPLKITSLQCKKIRKIYDSFATSADSLGGRARTGPNGQEGVRPADQVDQRGYGSRNNDLKRSFE